jgi:hypothetical protein
VLAGDGIEWRAGAHRAATMVAGGGARRSGRGSHAQGRGGPGLFIGGDRGVGGASPRYGDGLGRRTRTGGAEDRLTVKGAARDQSVRRTARGGGSRGGSRRVRPGKGAWVPREGAPAGPGRRRGGRGVGARARSSSNVLVYLSLTVFFSKFLN